jgi:hypothetical protein
MQYEQKFVVKYKGRYWMGQPPANGKLLTSNQPFFRYDTPEVANAAIFLLDQLGFACVGEEIRVRIYPELPCDPPAPTEHRTAKAVEGK